MKFSVLLLLVASCFAKSDPKKAEVCAFSVGGVSFACGDLDKQTKSVPIIQLPEGWSLTDVDFDYRAKTVRGHSSPPPFNRGTYVSGYLDAIQDFGDLEECISKAGTYGGEAEKSNCRLKYASKVADRMAGTSEAQ